MLGLLLKNSKCKVINYKKAVTKEIDNLCQDALKALENETDKETIKKLVESMEV